jgi:hypothetical protein
MFIPDPGSRIRGGKDPRSNITGFIRGILRGVRYAKSLRVLFLHRRSPSWTTLVLYSRAVFIFNEPTICIKELRSGMFIQILEVDIFHLGFRGKEAQDHDPDPDWIRNAE